MHSNDSDMAGVTALHVIFAVSIFALLFSGFGGVVSGTSRFLGDQSERGDLARRGVCAIESLTELVRGSHGESFIADPLGTTKLPDGSVTEIQIRRITGVNEELSAMLTEVIRICWRPAPGERVDGIDNNGNQVVDEGELVVIRANGSQRVLATGVPQRGLRFKDTGDGLVSLFLTLTADPARAGAPATSRVFDTRVVLR